MSKKEGLPRSLEKRKVYERGFGSQPRKEFASLIDTKREVGL